MRMLLALIVLTTTACGGSGSDLSTVSCRQNDAFELVSAIDLEYIVAETETENVYAPSCRIINHETQENHATGTPNDNGNCLVIYAGANFVFRAADDASSFEVVVTGGDLDGETLALTSCTSN